MVSSARSKATSLRLVTTAAFFCDQGSRCLRTRPCRQYRAREPSTTNTKIKLPQILKCTKIAASTTSTALRFVAPLRTPWLRTGTAPDLHVRHPRNLVLAKMAKPVVGVKSGSVVLPAQRSSPPEASKCIEISTNILLSS